MADDLVGRSARRMLDELRLTAGPYAEFALSARKKYVDLRLRQDPEIRSLYVRAADQVANEIRKLKAETGANELKIKHLGQLEQSLRDEANRLSQRLTERIRSYVSQSAEAGGSIAFNITMSLLERAGIDKEPIRQIFARTNTQATEAIWARSFNGLTLSDRIWEKGDSFRRSVRDIIQEGVAAGQDPVKTARLLEKYVRTGRATITADYPEMMERMGGRIPEDLSYEALRLVRTETAAAFGEGTIVASRVSPSYRGMKWVLSGSHPVPDICDDLAEADHGLGKGVWPPGQEPPMPAHPNCLCFLVPVHEDPDDFTQRLIEWVNNPSSHPDLEDWYQNTYRRSTGA